MLFCHHSAAVYAKHLALGPSRDREGSIVISLSNEIDHCMVFSLHVFEYTFVYDSAETARRTLTVFFQFGFHGTCRTLGRYISINRSRADRRDFTS